MKIKSFCDLFIAYNAISDFFIDSGLYARPDLGPDSTADHFFISYSYINETMALWKGIPGSQGLFKCYLK